MNRKKEEGAMKYSTRVGYLLNLFNELLEIKQNYPTLV